MKLRGTVIQGTLALAGLLAAYSTWQRGPEREEGSALVADISHKNLQKVRFASDGAWSELEPEGACDDRRFLVRISAAPTPPPPAHNDDEDMAPPDAGVQQSLPKAETAARAEPVVREYTAAKDADRVFKLFAPFYATRSLGAVDDRQRAALRTIADKTGTLELASSGGTYKYEVYYSPGNELAYLKPENSNQMYVFPGDRLETLRSGESLIERRPHDFEPGAYDTLVVKKDGKQREFKVTHEGRTVKLIPKAGKKADDFATNWHQKVANFYTENPLGKGENPPAGEPKVVLRLEYLNGGKPVGFTEIAKDPSGATFARTELLKGWAPAPAITQPAQEAEKILGAS